MYNRIWSCNIISEIEKGKTVYILDKQNKCVDRANTMFVKDLVEIIKQDDDDRYFIWEEDNEQGEV
jgi:hypothetical protein